MRVPAGHPHRARPRRPGWPSVLPLGGLLVLGAAIAVVVTLQFMSLPLAKLNPWARGEGCIIGMTKDGRTVAAIKQDEIKRKGMTSVLGNYIVLVDCSYEAPALVNAIKFPLIERRTTIITYEEWVPPWPTTGRRLLPRPRPGPAIDEEAASCFEENGKQWLADAIRNEPFEKRIVWANVWWLARAYRWHLAGGAVALYGCIVLCRLWRAWYRRRTGRCVHCAYPIGTTLPICPECGLENGGESGRLAGGSTRPGA